MWSCLFKPRWVMCWVREPHHNCLYPVLGIFSPLHPGYLAVWMHTAVYFTSSSGSFPFPFPRRGKKQSVGVDVSLSILQDVLYCAHRSVSIPSASVAQCLCCWRAVSLHERWIQNTSQQWSMSSEGACHPASISLSVLVMLHALRLHCKSGLLLRCSCWMWWSSWLLCPELLLSYCCCELLSSWCISPQG